MTNCCINLYLFSMTSKAFWTYEITKEIPTKLDDLFYRSFSG